MFTWIKPQYQTYNNEGKKHVAIDIHTPSKVNFCCGCPGSVRGRKNGLRGGQGYY
jgi:hypothetical protein